MVVPVTTIGSGTVRRRMAGTVAGHHMEPMPWVIVIETWYKMPIWRWAVSLKLPSSPLKNLKIDG